MKRREVQSSEREGGEVRGGDSFQEDLVLLTNSQEVALDLHQPLGLHQLVLFFVVIISFEDLM